MQYTIEGTEYEFHLDWNAIEQLESDPNYSIFEDMKSMDEKPRFQTLFRMARLIGWDYKSWCAEGYTVGQLAEVITGCLEEAGFRSAPASETSSSEDSAGQTD